MKTQNNRQNHLSSELDKICSDERKVNPQVLRSVIEIALEIAREGREGRKIGTLFVVGDSKKVLKSSRVLILDPLKGHSDDEKQISNENIRETLKELAQLDGAFIISEEGVVISATRYINAISDDIDLPLGLGSRHIAAASITKTTDAVAVVVSESSVVRIMDDGIIIAEIIPELWLYQKATLDASPDVLERLKNKQVSVISREKSENKIGPGHKE